MRTIREHFINCFNRDHVEVLALDAPNENGAHNFYSIDVFSGSKNSDGPSGDAAGINASPSISLIFQKGHVQDVGVNGITDEALIAVVIDRLKGFQRGRTSCRENALALTKLQEGMHWLRSRAEDRETRRVEGTDVA